MRRPQAGGSTRAGRPTHAAAAGRRRDILVAALDSFTHLGFAAATMDDIRTRAGASTGSLYHHFAGKEQLAAALYVEALRDYQTGFIATLAPRLSARRAARLMVEYHLSWVQEHPDWARYLLDMGRQAELVAATRAEVEAMNMDFSAAVLAWLAPHFERGVLRRLPPPLLYAVLLGPAQYLARQWLAGRPDPDLAAAVPMLADAAWRALRLARAPGKRAR